MSKGYLALVLHAHLPFIRHPENEDHLEERWLFEAITETYVPLLNIMNGLVHDDVPFKLTMTITPSLCNMLSDELLQERFVNHIENLLDLAEKEIIRTNNEAPDFTDLAIMYKNIFESVKETFDKTYHRNLLNGFRDLQESGHLEIITCGATHGFLPLMRNHPEAIRGQIMTAVEDYERHFGRRPKGIWLPECGYFEGLDRYLAEADIHYFLLDTHGFNFSHPQPYYGIYAPVFCPTGVAAFGRDKESSKQVWSSKEGYPGDFSYREFYRDVGFDLPFEYIRKHIHADGIRLNTGVKYFKITGNGQLGERQPYNRWDALETAANHAGNFMFNREQQIEWLAEQMPRKPIILSPYDAELFGHWWFEGPEFLNFLIRKTAYDQDTYELTTPKHYLEEYPTNQIATPAGSSWGDKGYYEVWLNGTNDWIYPHLHAAAERMVELAGHPLRYEEPYERAIQQAARELLLAQSSDWAFIMTTETAVDYAVQRTMTHLDRFNKFYQQILNGQLDEAYLNDVEKKDNIFPNINPDFYRRKR